MAVVHPPCADPTCYMDGEHGHFGDLFTGHRRYLINPIEGEEMATAPQAPNRSSVVAAKTVTLAKDGRGKATLDEFRSFVEAAEGFDGSREIEMQVWDDQREGMHIKISVTE